MRVAIVDDDALFREGLTAVLSGLGVSVESVHSGEALETFLADPPDIVLVDVMLDGSPHGLRLVRDLTATGSRKPAAIVLSSFAPRHFVQLARDNGAAGYLPKDVDTETLLAAMRVVAGGGHVFPPARQPLGRGPSPREVEIIRCVAEGLSSEEAGLRLGITGRTVESHLARMFQRYSIASRTQLVLFAARKGWIVELPTRD